MIQTQSNSGMIFRKSKIHSVKPPQVVPKNDTWRTLEPSYIINIDTRYILISPNSNFRSQNPHVTQHPQNPKSAAPFKTFKNFRRSQNLDFPTPLHSKIPLQKFQKSPKNPFTNKFLLNPPSPPISTSQASIDRQHSQALKAHWPHL